MQIFRVGRLRQGVSLVAVAAMLGGCVTTQEQRIGAADPSDQCRPYVVALDSTGNFFAEDIVKGAFIGAVGGAVLGGLLGGGARGAAIGAATGAIAGAATGYWVALNQQSRDQAVLATRVQNDLSRENAEIDRSQQAFNALMDCRFAQAKQVRTDVAEGRSTLEQGRARMAQIKGWADRDIALAQQINSKIASRGDEFVVAAENLQPGTKSQIDAQKAAAPATRRAVATRQAPVRLRPDPAAPEIASLAPRDTVTITGGQDGFALVETPSGMRGYAPADTLRVGSSRVTTASTASGSGSDVTTLAATNVAKRDNFSQSVAVAQSASSSGFELTS
ncbi:YMGG-like glycine zipper-containing protein [Elioraea rosea]|uniref:YMGG-like glycine zipper-containing protein n=1 Tax=Elioraea rosea TaxID=2492390 RepID=UPI0011854B0D|nr:SH3 domain-containing protein [Elioraea rosea]